MKEMHHNDGALLTSYFKSTDNNRKDLLQDWARGGLRSTDNRDDLEIIQLQRQLQTKGEELASCKDELQTKDEELESQKKINSIMESQLASCKDQLSNAQRLILSNVTNTSLDEATRDLFSDLLLEMMNGAL